MPHTGHFDPEKSKVYLSQKTFVFNSENKFLTLLRTATAPHRPLKWDLPGGAYEVGETPEDNVRREIREETGFEVEDIQPVCLVEDHIDERPVMTVAYRAIATSTDVYLSNEHQEYRWVSKEEFLDLDSSLKWRHIAETYLP